MKLPKNEAPKIALRNIRRIADLENLALAHRSAGERVGDAIARMAGRLWFLGVHLAWFAAWLIVNGAGIRGIPKFDPYPFPFLNFVVSLEAIFLALFILMSQNRASRQADQRAHLDLQINLLNELETTKILQMLQALCREKQLGIAEDPEIEQLTQPTELSALVEEINSHLPEAG